MNELTDLPHELLSFKSDFDSPTEIIVVNENDVESAMTDQAVHYLIDEILKKKKDLHDPRHRCNRFFGEIRDLLIAQHGLYFSIRTLERKYHYLKRHFDTMCQNNFRGAISSKGSKAWQYFDKMMEIFAEELDIEDAPTMASLYPDLPLPKSALPVTQSIKEECLKNTELSSQEDRKSSAESNDDEIPETTWNHAVVLDFLNICVGKKDEFWDPEHRRRDILIDIQNKMKAKGHFFKLESLDRKLKNLKACYHGSTQSVRKKPSLKNRTRWPYFAQLDELYNGFRENKVGRKKTGRKQAKRGDIVVRRRRRRTRLPKPEVSDNKLDSNSDTQNWDEHPMSITTQVLPVQCKPDPIEHYHVPAPNTFDSIDRRDSCSPGDFDCYMKVDETQTDDDLVTETAKSTETTANNVVDDAEFAQKLLALEERRTIATEQLLEQLEESNRIRQRKIQFTRNKLAYLKARAKRRELL